MTVEKEYWDSRAVETGGSRLRRLGQRLKTSRVGLGLLSFFLPSRVADEHYLRRVLRRFSPKSALDVACGAGKPVLPANITDVYGVDITGFPQHLAEQIGYKRAIAYEPPDYEFDLDTTVDLVTCINLNAHIPFDSFHRILSNALEYLKEDGTLVLIAELDNSGISYSRFSDPSKKAALVNGMEHYYFEDRTAFMGKFHKAFPQLKLIEERSLAAVTTLNQHYVYRTGREPGTWARRFILAGDILTGPVNSVYTKLRPGCESFLVGFVFKKPGRSGR